MSADEPLSHQRDQIKVLAVDDEPMNLDLLERSLRRNYSVLAVADPTEALEVLREHRDIAIILSDYRMPEMSGAELLAKARHISPDAKRVIITGYADVDNLVEAINQGQIHYIIQKPWNHRDLDRILTQLIKVNRLERENRDLLNQLRAANEALRDKERLLARNLDDRSRDLLAANDELERINRELEVLSYRDALTGLYNHRAFRERLEEELGRARRYRQSLSLLMANVDGLREINAKLGYQLGDEVLRRIAQALSGADDDRRLRDSDVLARYSGEDFAILLPDTDREGASIKAERLCQMASEAAFPADLEITISVGIASFPGDCESTDELVAQAKAALRLAKRDGANSVAVCDSEDVHDNGGGASGESNQAPVAQGDGEPPTVANSQVAMRAYGHVDSDDSHEFPTYHEHLLTIFETLERNRAVSCLYADLSRLRRVELEYGVAKHAELFAKAGRLIDTMRGGKLRLEDSVYRTIDGDAYLCFLSPPRSGSLETAPDDLEDIANRVRQQLEVGLAEDVQDLIHEYPRITVGYARVLDNSMVRPQRLIAGLIKEAADSALLMAERNSHRNKTMLQEIILQSSLRPVYQPIVHLESGDVFGFEALTRGPRGTPLESPKALFGVADEVGLTFELDRACFRNALGSAAGIEPVHRLFVNLLPLSFYDASFIEREVGKLLEAAALTPANVVFEITEKLAIENFVSFRRALGVYTSMGFGIAIDDVGTRHSNLETVMSLRPNFIKVSDVLTRGVSRSTVKREMFRSLGNIAAAIDAVVVAEGIETPDDLAMLHDLGVHYGQGFFLARPSPPFARLRPSVRRALRTLSSMPRRPTEAPPAEFDEDGDFCEADAPDTGVRLRAKLLASGSGQHEIAAIIAQREPSEAPTQPVRPAKVPAPSGASSGDNAVQSSGEMGTESQSLVSEGKKLRH